MSGVEDIIDCFMFATPVMFGQSTKILDELLISASLKNTSELAQRFKTEEPFGILVLKNL